MASVLAGQNLPVSLKPIATYLQRAKEIAPAAPQVAYYMRLYALQLALDLRPKMAAGDMGVLIALMDAMDIEKAGVDLASVDEPSVLVENFAQDLFLRADESDRAGAADARVGRAFYVASLLIDVCRQFGALPADLAEKHKYARWRYLEFSKAVKEGRPPAPPPNLGADALLFPPDDGGGGDGGEPAAAGGGAGAPTPPAWDGGGAVPPNAPPSAHVGDYGGYGGAPPPPMPPPPPQFAPAPPSAPPPGYPPPPAAYPPPPAAYPPPPHVPSPPFAPPPPPPSHYHHQPAAPSGPPAALAPEALFAAQRHAKFAVSALQFADVPTAVQNLHAALAALGAAARP